MEELYLNGSNLWLINRHLTSKISILFQTISSKRKSESLSQCTFVKEVERIIETIKDIAESLKEQKGTEIQKLLESTNIFDATNKDGETALILAASQGHYEIVEMLLAEKANPEIATKFDCTAATYALQGCEQWSYEESIPYLKVLVAFLKGNPNLKARGYPVLHAAIDWGNPEPAKLFLEAGANPNITDDRTEIGNTALDVAAERYGSRNFSKKTVVLLLLDAGADPSLENGRNLLPLDYVWDRQGEEDQEIAQLLVYYSRDKITLACEEVLPLVLCNSVADYCLGEIDAVVKKFVPRSTPKTGEPEELKSENEFSDINADQDQKLIPPRSNRLLQVPDLKFAHRFFPGICCRPLVISCISGSFGLAGLLITACTGKDAMSKKVFHSVLALEILFIFLIVYFSYKLSKSNQIINDQAGIEPEKNHARLL